MMEFFSPLLPHPVGNQFAPGWWAALPGWLIEEGAVQYFFVYICKKKKTHFVFSCWVILPITLYIYYLVCLEE